ncbi:MAG TPA: DUF1080 domain-containing protein [Tepidisphaeraceae bacterium]|nr:DUF1080 domain-containing protein [Tepidisphaeraceae bacterium]
MICSAFVASSACAQTSQPAGNFKPLFNGKDLTGFYTYLKGDGKNNDPQKVFQVDRDGVVHIYRDSTDGAAMPFGYFATEEEFSDYHLRFQYKWGTKRFGGRSKSRRDAGCLYHVTGPDGWLNGTWPFSIECQVMEQDTGDIFAVGTSVTTMIDPAKAKTPTFMEATAGGIEYTSPQKMPVNSRVIRDPMAEVDGWNTVEIIVRGDSAVHIVNGRVNNRILHATVPNLDKPGEWVPLRKGRILFQAEGAEVCYRNIEMHPVVTDEVR